MLGPCVLDVGDPLGRSLAAASIAPVRDARRDVRETSRAVVLLRETFDARAAERQSSGMRAGPTAGWHRTGLRSLILTAAVALPGGQAQAQSAPGDTACYPDFRQHESLLRHGCRYHGWSDPAWERRVRRCIDGCRLPKRRRFFADGRWFGRHRCPAALPFARSACASSAGNNRNPTDLLRLRAFPPRRFGVATTRPVRSIVRTPSPDLRLTPVIRNAVVGAPLPTPSPAPPLAPSLTLLPLAGISTPGAFLGSALRRPLVVDEAYAPLGLKLGTFTFLPVFQQSVGLRHQSGPGHAQPRQGVARPAHRGRTRLPQRLVLARTRGRTPRRLSRLP